MIDAETGTVWSHLDGMALSGAQAGTQLDVRPLQTTTWGAWVDQYPDTTVPHADTGYRYGRGNIGSPALGSTFLDTLDGVDDRLAVNELVIGVLAGTESRAFPLAELPPTRRSRTWWARSPSSSSKAATASSRSPTIAR